MTALLFVSLLLIAAIWTVRHAERRHAQRDLIHYRLRFPSGLDEKAVAELLAAISGLLGPWWRRWLAPAVVGFEIEASSEGIEHFILIPRAWGNAVENLLHAHVPAVSYEVAARTVRPVRVAAEYSATSGVRPLRIDPGALSATLLASLQPLTGTERIVLQWLLTPHGPIAAPSAEPLPFGRGRRKSAEEMAAQRRKHASPQLLAVARIGANARTTQRARRLVRRAEVAWHGTRAPGVHLKRRLIPEGLAVGRLTRRVVPVSAWPLVLGADELTGLLGWPIAVTGLPGLALGGHRELPAGRLLPQAGTVLGTSTFPGTPRPVALDAQARLRHLAILGPTGVGKTTLLAQIALADLAAGSGLVVVDPKHDLVEAILERVSPERADDVLVLDPADVAPIGLNPLAVRPGQSPDLAVERVWSLFKGLWSANWGPRSGDVLYSALTTLVGSGEPVSLVDLPTLLANPAFRARLVAKLDDPVTIGFWDWWEGLSPAEQGVVAAPVLNKTRALLSRKSMRAVIGQTAPAIDMADVLASGKVLLVSLRSGLIGEEAASLLGALVVSELWAATLARASLPAAERHMVSGIVDEAHRFVHLPVGLGTALVEARSHGLALTVAHQHRAQLPTEMRAALDANARSKVVFQLPPDDAQAMARFYSGLLTADDLQGLGAYEAVVSAYAGGATQPPATIHTLPLAEPTSDPVVLRDRSRRRYGRTLEETDTAHRKHQATSTRAPVGRRAKGATGGDR